MFFLAPRSVSSVPLHHYRSTARLSPTPRGMQTHIKRGPAAHFEDFQALLFLLSSFLSFSQCDPHAGRLSFLAAHTHTRTHTPTAVPHSAHLAATVELDRWGLLPLCHLQTSPLRFLTLTLMQVNITSIKSQNTVCFFTYFRVFVIDLDVDELFLKTGSDLFHPAARSILVCYSPTILQL